MLQGPGGGDPCRGGRGDYLDSLGGSRSQRGGGRSRGALVTVEKTIIVVTGFFLIKSSS